MFHGDIEVHGKVIKREVETKINTVVAAEENQTVFSVNDIEDQVSVKDSYSMDLNIGTCLHPLRSDLAMTARCINCSLEKFNNERIECCIYSNLINCSNWEYNTAFHVSSASLNLYILFADKSHTFFVDNTATQFKTPAKLWKFGLF